MWNGSAFSRDHDSFSLKLVDRNLIRVHVRFGASDKVRWEIKCDEFFKAGRPTAFDPKQTAPHSSSLAALPRVRRFTG